MRKYGSYNFTYEILQAYDSSEEALDDEDRWINLLKTRAEQNGYNCTAGGAGPDKQSNKRKRRKTVLASEETKKKISQAKTETHDRLRTSFLPLLKTLHSEGLSNRQIGDETGLCQVTIRKWLALLGLHSNARKRNPKEAEPEIIDWHRKGKTVKQISLLVKCKTSTVSRILKENGIVFGMEAQIQRNTTIISWLWTEEFSVKDIRRLLGMSESAIRKYIWKRA